MKNSIRTMFVVLAIVMSFCCRAEPLRSRNRYGGRND
jgi:hypothetical protein